MCLGASVRLCHLTGVEKLVPAAPQKETEKLVCEQLHVVVGHLGSKLVLATNRVRGNGAAELHDEVPGVRCPAGEVKETPDGGEGCTRPPVVREMLWR